jgi:hypothetical protein
MGLAVWMLAAGSVGAAAESEMETAAPREADVDSGTDPRTDADAASEASAGEADDRAKPSPRSSPPPPLGVRFGEPLEGQRFRVAYSFEQMQRKGMLSGDNQVSPSDVLNGSFNPYNRTPRRLELTAHTVQLAYAPHPRATLVVEVPFLMKKLRTRDDQGRVTQEQTQGVGDIGFALVVPFIRKGNERSQVHIGFDIPTGSIRRGGDETRLPFDSQIGNGSYDFEWGWTYRGELDWFSWGGQATGRHPIDRNDLHYRTGSRFDISGWGAVRLLAGMSSSLRVGWHKQNNIRVASGDFRAGTINDPSDNPKARGGFGFTVSPGLTVEWPQLSNQRVAVEFDIPVYQNLDGPQLKEQWSVRAGWQWGF